MTGQTGATLLRQGDEWYDKTMKAQDLDCWLTEEGISFFTGVPDTFLAPLLSLWEALPRERHLPAPREDLAVGLAVGAALAGERPLLYMQNSGLGYSLEALASLPMIYRVPLILLVSHRGPEDIGWEEHRIMGEKTEELLALFSIPFSRLERCWREGQERSIRETLAQKGLYALLVGRGGLE